jgi:hypothetical protein
MGALFFILYKTENGKIPEKYFPEGQKSCGPNLVEIWAADSFSASRRGQR